MKLRLAPRSKCCWNSWLAVCLLATACNSSELFAAEALREIAKASFDTPAGWQDSNRPEDKPLSFGPASDPADIHEGASAIRLDFDRGAGPVGMKYFRLPSVAGSDGCSFWLRGDGSKALFQVRFLQRDFSMWDSPIMRIDFTGWRRFVILQSECTWRDPVGGTANWDDLQFFAIRFSSRSCQCVIDDLRFYNGTALLNAAPQLPAVGPLRLRVDLNSKLPPIPETLKGVDFALINWFASDDDRNFGPETYRLFRDSCAKLVRFWTYCPAFNLSPNPGEYNWGRFDAQMQKIYDAGAEAIMTCCFTPEWLSADESKEGKPTDWDAYERLLIDTVHHCHEHGWRVRYWEVWNEPDLTTGTRFLDGNLDDLCEIYTHFAGAVRAADPRAKVGGGGFARFNEQWLLGLVVHADKNELPLDFLSWHGYELTPDGIADSIKSARRYLQAFPRFKDTELAITEWQAHGGPPNRCDTEYAAAYQAAAFHRMVENDLNLSVFFCFKESNWQFPRREFGGSWGMITALDTPKPSYHSFRIFAELQGDRLRVEGDDGEVGALAARQGEGLDIMLYRFNDRLGASERIVYFDLKGWAEKKMDVTFELVDSLHSNPLRDPDSKALKRVGLWTGIDVERFAQLEFRLNPLSVARIRVMPSPSD